MPDTVTIEVEPAAALDDRTTRARIGRPVSRALCPASAERMSDVVDAISDEARRRGLTDEILR